MKPFDPRITPHLAPARLSLAGALAAAALNSLLVIGIAFALTDLVVDVVRDRPLAATATTLLALVGTRAAVVWVGDLASARAAAAIGVHVRDQILSAALRLGSVGRSRRMLGETAALATRGAAAIEPYVTRYLPSLVLAGVLPFLTIVVIGIEDWISAVVVVLTLPLIPVFAALIGMATRDASDRQWRTLSQLSGHFLDVMKGLPTLVAYRRAEAQSSSIRRITDRYREVTMATLKIAFASSVALELIATLSVALVAVEVGLRLQAGGMDLSTALVVLLLAPEAYWPLRRVGAEFHSAAEGMSTLEEVELVKAEAAAAYGDGSETPLSLAITLDDVTLTHPGRPGPVQTGLSTRIPDRGLTVVAGPSGAGKSTLLSAVLGDIPVAAGQIRIGGVPLTDVDRRWWRRRVAVVGQRPWILAGTVRENLAIARPDADDGAIWAALSAVGLDAHVRSLPGGLLAEVAEDGASLSAGQRARLALARVVLADRPVVVLDEPTAHLDEPTERVFLETLGELARDRCVVVVAHRPEVIARADTLVRLHHTPLPRSGADSPRIPAPEPGSAAAAVDESPVPPAHARLRLALGALLGALAATSGVALMATSGWLITRAAEHPPVLYLFAAIVGVRTFGLARPVFRYAERLVSHDVALRLLAERRAAVYDALVPLVPGALGKQRGDVLASVVDDVDALVDRQLRVRTPLLTWLAATGIVAGVGWLLDPGSALILTLALLLAGGVGWLVSRAGAARLEGRSIEGRAAVSREVARALGGADDISAWQAEETFLGAVRESGRRAAAATVGSAAVSALARAIVLASCGLATVLVADHVAGLVPSGGLSGPVAALLVLVPLALVDVLAPATDAGALGVRVRTADARIATLLAAPPTVADPASPVPLSGSRPALAGRGLAASWSGAEVFADLDLDLPPGRRLGVVGPSGSGKSTLVALLMRFVDPSAGSYRIGEADARDLRLADVRRTVGLVDDDPHVFGSTVYENIRLARPDATEAQVEAALRGAHLGRWVDALPRGLATRIGDGGAAVSGGERARIGFARALLADPAALVLDEPTAHLDADTAQRVADTILDSNPGRTLVWVTHGTIGLDRMDDTLTLAVDPSLVSR